MRKSEFKAFLQAVKALRDGADDKTASAAAALYPALKQDGQLLKAGTRINLGGQIYRSRVDLWDTEENNPINAPSIWEEVKYKEGYRSIPQVITAENHSLLVKEAGGMESLWNRC